MRMFFSGDKKYQITKSEKQIRTFVIRIFHIDKVELEMDNPWEGILAPVIFALQSTVHTTLGATPMQLVFGQDAIQNISHKANWQ